LFDPRVELLDIINGLNPLPLRKRLVAYVSRKAANA